jgi:hypothetical protein
MRFGVNESGMNSQQQKGTFLILTLVLSQFKIDL